MYVTLTACTCATPFAGWVGGWLACLYTVCSFQIIHRSCVLSKEEGERDAHDDYLQPVLWSVLLVALQFSS